MDGKTIPRDRTIRLMSVGGLTPIGLGNITTEGVEHLPTADTRKKILSCSERLCLNTASILHIPSQKITRIFNLAQLKSI